MDIPWGSCTPTDRDGDGADTSVAAAADDDSNGALECWSTSVTE